MASYLLPDDIKVGGECPKCRGTLAFETRDRGAKLHLVCSNNGEHSRRANVEEVNDFATRKK